jgi:hypothetical protein
MSTLDSPFASFNPMETETLKTIVEMVKSLGAESKEAFIWYLAAHYGVNLLMFLVAFASIIYVIRLVIGALSKKSEEGRYLLELAKAAGTGSYPLDLVEIRNTVSYYLDRARELKDLKNTLKAQADAILKEPTQPKSKYF